MRKVFVDTVAWIALINTSDDLHANALEVMRELCRENVRLVTTDFVLLEVADALSAPTIRTKTVAFIEGLRHLMILQVIPASRDLMNNGWSLFRRRDDKDWGLTDCTSFSVMSDERIGETFTSDQHFKQAGFLILLSAV